jgi:hypothetical protein
LGFNLLKEEKTPSLKIWKLNFEQLSQVKIFKKQPNRIKKGQK